MKRYGYNAGIVGKRNTAIILWGIDAIAGIILLLMMFCSYSELYSWQKEDEGLFYIFFMVIGGINVITGFASMVTAAVCKTCLMTNYLEITDNKISGMVCKNLKDANSTEFFALAPEEVEKAELVTNNPFYTLYIHTMHGSFKLCLENAAGALRNIESCQSGKGLVTEPASETHKWLCKCGASISRWPCLYCGREGIEVEKVPDGFWRCMACGNLVSTRQNTCSCGGRYK